MSRIAFICLTGLVALFAGCGQSDSTAENSPSGSDQPRVTGATVSPADADPAEIVRQFLAAVQNADDAVAASLLTDEARQRTSEAGITVQPTGAPTAKYQVGRVETPEAGKAWVSCSWTEPDATGNLISSEIVWLVRKQADGWRVYGMATEVNPGSPPLVLNFENPAEMIAKWQNAAGGAQPEDPATNGGAPGTAPTRQAQLDPQTPAPPIGQPIAR